MSSFYFWTVNFSGRYSYVENGTKFWKTYLTKNVLLFPLRLFFLGHFQTKWHSAKYHKFTEVIVYSIPIHQLQYFC